MSYIRLFWRNNFRRKKDSMRRAFHWQFQRYPWRHPSLHSLHIYSMNVVLSSTLQFQENWKLWRTVVKNLKGSAWFVTNKRAWSITMKFLTIFFMSKERFHMMGIPLAITTVPFVPPLTSFATEIFHECCPFLHSPVPLKLRFRIKWNMAAKWIFSRHAVFGNFSIPKTKSGFGKNFGIGSIFQLTLSFLVH